MSRVYFIKPIDFPGPIKIGCSASPLKRRDALSAWSPFPLEIIAEIEGDHSIERRFHARHVASFRGFEWFDLTPELQADIEAIRAGTFDVSCLPADQGDVRYIAKRQQTFTDVDWEYASLFGRASAAWRGGLRDKRGHYPTSPCIFQKMSASRKAQEIARVRSLIGAAA